MENLTWIVFDILGTIAFAISGAMVGITKRMDIFGIAVLAIMTAVGGGITRDLIVGINPPSAFRNPTDFILAIAFAFIVSIIYGFDYLRERKKKYLKVLFDVSDTLGLAAFTVTGTVVGLKQAAGNYVLAIVLGTLTAVGGGILRDVMAQRLPVVFYADFYAAAAILGAGALCLTENFLGDLNGASWLGFFTATILRFMAIRFSWSLYHPKKGASLKF